MRSIGGVYIPTLSSTVNFLYLCVHGSRHQWKRLFWVLDIVRIIEKEGDAFLLEAYEIALESNLQRDVLTGCQLAHQLFGVDLPQRIHEAIQSDTQLIRLTAIAIFFINNTTLPAVSPLSSSKALSSGVKRVLYFYQATYYLAGVKAINTTIKKFFINPDYWRVYSVSDKYFAINYVVAPILWAYCFFRKKRGLPVS